MGQTPFPEPADLLPNQARDLRPKPRRSGCEESAQPRAARPDVNSGFDALEEPLVLARKSVEPCAGRPPIRGRSISRRDELLPDFGLDPEPPPEDVPPAPEPLDPERAAVIEPVAESSGDDPEPPPPPPPPPEAVPPVTLPVASFTVPATSSTASLTEPVTPSAASPTLFVWVRSEACPVGDAAVETAELSVSTGSSWTPATALPESPPKTSEAKSRMGIAADFILTRRYPQSVALNRRKW